MRWPENYLNFLNGVLCDGLELGKRMMRKLFILGISKGIVEGGYSKRTGRINMEVPVGESQ